MSEIRIVLLDLGDVIVEIDSSDAVSKLGLSESDIAFISKSSMHDRYERDQITSDEFFRFLKSELKIKNEIDEIELAWKSLLGPAIVGVDDVFKKYSDKVQYYALSNTDRTHLAQDVRARSIFMNFKGIFTSYELGCRKPEPIIYKKVIESLKCRPDEILFIDDKIENVEAARAIGIHAEQCKRSAQRLDSILSKYLK